MRASTNVVDVNDDYQDNTPNVNNKYKIWTLIIVAVWIVYGIYTMQFTSSNMWIEIVIMILFATPSVIEIKAWHDSDDKWSDLNEGDNEHEVEQKDDKGAGIGYIDRIRNYYNGSQDENANPEDEGNDDVSPEKTDKDNINPEEDQNRNKDKYKDKKQNANRKHEENVNREKNNHNKSGIIFRWVYMLFNAMICIYFCITCIMAFKKTIDEKISLLAMILLTVESIVRLGYSMMTEIGKLMQLIAFITMSIVSVTVWVGIATGFID